MKNKKIQFSSIVIALLFIFLAFGSGETESNTSPEQVDSSSTKAVTSTYRATCSNCGKNINGYGYKMVSEGNCVPCEEENSTDCSFCSEACGLEHDRKSTEGYNKVLNKYGYDSLNEDNESNNQSTSDCSFTSDSDVLSYLIGKTFTQQGGDMEIRFSTDGAIISGQEEYQWLSYHSLGGYKGYVKLASTNPTHPDGTIKLWVSCRENSVTDGQTVLLYN
jgi:hypothetical protein